MGREVRVQVPPPHPLHGRINSVPHKNSPSRVHRRALDAGKDNLVGCGTTALGIRGTVVAGVKEVDRNPDGAGLRSLAGSARGWKGLSGTPGQRVHKKIADTSKQVKALTKERLPGILVLTVGGLTSAD